MCYVISCSPGHICYVFICHQPAGTADENESLWLNLAPLHDGLLVMLINVHCPFLNKINVNIIKTLQFDHKENE